MAAVNAIVTNGIGPASTIGFTVTLGYTPGVVANRTGGGPVAGQISEPGAVAGMVTEPGAVSGQINESGGIAGEIA